MADGSGGVGILGVIVGAALVLIIGYVIIGVPFGGGGGDNVNIRVEPPAVIKGE